VGEKFGCPWTTRIEDVLSDDRIQILSIVTPDHAHASYAIAALNAGKHVLLEKPMAESTVECRAILAARDLSGRKLMVNYHNRWYPAFVAARDAIAAGRIGRPVCGNFVLSDTISWVEGNMTWAEHTGPEWFLMVHIADLAFWMLNDQPKEVFAMARQGLLASKGETGRIDLAADYEGITVTADKYQTPFVLLKATEEPPIQDFISCVLEDKPVPVSGEAGMLATQAVEAVVESYQTNEVVKLE
jgi:predicted dehydrogenase